MPPRPERVNVSPEHLEFYRNVGKEKWNEMRSSLFSQKGDFQKKLLFAKR